MEREFKDEGFVRRMIKGCQTNGHVQQVAYSTFHDCITQICFSCGKVRTSMKEREAN